jgi:hypothetical protein
MLLCVNTGSVDLRLTIDLGSDPISGSVELAGREPVRFRGWIDLVAAIEAARSTVTAARGLEWMPGARPAERQFT